MAVSKIPAGYHSVTAYITVSPALEAIAFYIKAFHATEVMKMMIPGNIVAHAEIKIGNSHIMLADEMPEFGNKGPKTLGGTSCGFMIYVEDVDKAFAHAVACGATITKPLMDQFYGDRSGTVTDPFGHIWTLTTHIEDVSPEEMDRRMKAMMGG